MAEIQDVVETDFIRQITEDIKNSKLHKYSVRILLQAKLTSPTVATQLKKSLLAAEGADTGAKMQTLVDVLRTAQYEEVLTEEIRIIYTELSREKVNESFFQIGEAIFSSLEGRITSVEFLGDVTYAEVAPQAMLDEALRRAVEQFRKDRDAVKQALAAAKSPSDKIN